MKKVFLTLVLVLCVLNIANAQKLHVLEALECDKTAAVEGTLTLGLANTSDGTIILANSSNSYTLTLTITDTTPASYTLRFPAAAPGATQILRSDASGNFTWVTMAAATIPASTQAKSVLIGDGASGWVEETDCLIDTAGIITGTKIMIDNIYIDAALILSDSGAIGFGDDNLSTTGTFSAEDLASTDDADINDNLTVGDIIVDEANGVIDFTSGTSATISASGAGAISFSNDDIKINENSKLILDDDDNDQSYILCDGTDNDYVKFYAGGTCIFQIEP